MRTSSRICSRRRVDSSSWAAESASVIDPPSGSFGTSEMQKMTGDVIGSRGALLMMLLMAGRPLSGQELRPVTVKDAITTVNIMSADALMDRPAVFSPGGGRFAVVVERGDLGRNRRVFALVLFR